MKSRRWNPRTLSNISEAPSASTSPSSRCWSATQRVTNSEQLAISSKTRRPGRMMIVQLLTYKLIAMDCTRSKLRNTRERAEMAEIWAARYT